MKGGTLTCREVAARATDYMERPLPLCQRLQIGMHLLICASCRRYVRQLALTRDTMRRLPRPLPSDEDVDRLLHVFQSRRRRTDLDSR